MFEQQPTLELLFEQLGLDSDQQAIEKFVEEHQLPHDVAFTNADFWNDSQRDFLRNRSEQDDDWAIVVDELNQLLHSDSQTS
ncbi:MAG: DUF2789 family protein [Acinetobacter sp.]